MNRYSCLFVLAAVAFTQVSSDKFQFTPNKNQRGPASVSQAAQTKSETKENNLVTCLGKNQSPKLEDEVKKLLKDKVEVIKESKIEAEKENKENKEIKKSANKNEKKKIAQNEDEDSISIMSKLTNLLLSQQEAQAQFQSQMLMQMNMMMSMMSQNNYNTFANDYAFGFGYGYPMSFQNTFTNFAQSPYSSNYLMFNQSGIGIGASQSWPQTDRQPSSLNAHQFGGFNNAMYSNQINPQIDYFDFSRDNNAITFKQPDIIQMQKQIME